MEILRHLTAVGIFTIRSREVPPSESTRFSPAAVAVCDTTKEVRRKAVRKKKLHALDHPVNKWGGKKNGLSIKPRKEVGMGGWG